MKWHKSCSRLPIARDRLTAGIYLSDDPDDILGCLEDTLRKVIEASPIRRRLRKADHAPPPGVSHNAWLEGLLKEGVITQSESDILGGAYTATMKAIAVDDFEPGNADTGKSAGEYRQSRLTRDSLHVPTRGNDLPL